MEVSEIPPLNITADLMREVQALRAAAPRPLHSIIEGIGATLNAEALADLEPGSVVALEGGRLSACYCLRNGGGYVLKMRRNGVEAEVEALHAWRQAAPIRPK
jgi:hypothetical protein